MQSDAELSELVPKARFPILVGDQRCLCKSGCHDKKKKKTDRGFLPVCHTHEEELNNKLIILKIRGDGEIKD